MATLTFQIDQPTVQAGGVLSGSFVLRTTQQIAASSVEIYFRGKEYTYIEKGSGKNKKELRNKIEVTYHDLGSHLATQRIVGGGYINPGAYEFPFEIILQDSLPPSMWVYSDDDYAKVEYCLRAKFKGSGVFADYEARRVINMLAKPSLERAVPRLVDPFVRRVNYLAAWEMGELCIGARVLDTELMPGQPAEVILGLRNDSEASPQKVKLKLQEIVNWTVGSEKSSKTRTLAKTELVLKNQQKPLDKQTRLELKANKHERREQNQRDIMNELQEAKPTEALRLPIPQLTTSGFKSANIEVSHQLVVKVMTESMITNPEFYVPIRILAGGATPTRSASPPVAQATAVVEESLPLADAVPIRDESVRQYPDFGVAAVPIPSKKD
ncbi:Arrestin domain containing [Seminavis robusta]|uniref:Arrestin domain containing n=1 Tax=Seminavis robusta TaxID=568900 RepID=A0A9N8E1M6_9STRA|nr:Arrestin domain containing [Seminavis robusta]|eukprot:Sro527_g160650.1 Arrestin domain containing (383) ;mRNA; r:27123-28271